MTTIFFGTRWDAPLLDDPDDDSAGPTQVSTPVGELCFHCGQEIRDGDRGLIRALISGVPPRARSAPIHTECEMIGIMGHVFGVCSHTGFDTAARESALELLREVNARRRLDGQGPL